MNAPTIHSDDLQRGDVEFDEEDTLKAAKMLHHLCAPDEHWSTVDDSGMWLDIATEVGRVLIGGKPHDELC